MEEQKNESIDDEAINKIVAIKKKRSKKKVHKALNPPKKTWCTVCQNWVGTVVFQDHLKSRKHCAKLGNRQRMNKLALKNAQRGIIVRGTPSELAMEFLIRHFTQFGDILAIAGLGPGEIMLQFENNLSAQKACKSPNHTIQGVDVSVAPRSFKSPDCQNNSTETTSSKSELAQKIRKYFSCIPCGEPLDNQISKLVNKFQASEHLRKTKSQIMSDLSGWLLLKFPKHVLHMFGSSATGLDLDDNSDIDLYLEYDPETCETDSPEIKKEKLKLAANVISAHPDVKFFIVVPARVPVAKFLHINSNIKCDLIADSIKGVKNSKFLADIQTLDLRIKPFLFMLKIWAKAHSIAGDPSTGAFTSYAVTLLGIFYLQQTASPLIPPIVRLQSQVPVGQREIHHGWNFSYVLAKQSAADKPLTSQDTVFTLLKGFFNFFQSFDPKDIVICPIVGNVVPRESFSSSPPSLDKGSFEPYLKYINEGGKPLNFGLQLALQDPFELNFNVSSAFNKFEFFQKLCKKAFKICSDIEVAVVQGKSMSISTLFNPTK